MTAFNFIAQPPAIGISRPDKNRQLRHQIKGFLWLNSIPEGVQNGDKYPSGFVQVVGVQLVGNFVQKSGCMLLVFVKIECNHDTSFDCRPGGVLPASPRRGPLSKYLEDWNGP